MAKVKMNFKANFHNVNLIRVAIQGVCQEVFGSQQDADDFLLSITEAMNNVVYHSETPTMEAMLTISKDSIIFGIITEGKKFDSTIKVEMPDINSEEEGGFGLPLIQGLVNSIHYEYTEGKNILTLEKKLLSDDKEE